MARFDYNPTNWKDDFYEYPDRFRIQNNDDGSITLIPHHGELIQEGTEFNAKHMNNIEDGIKNLYDNLDLLKVDLTSQQNNIIDLGLELEMIKDTTLNGVNDCMEIETFQDLSEVTVFKGLYDKVNKNIYLD